MWRPVRTPSYYRRDENNWLFIIRTPGAKLETGAKTEHGRLLIDQNTNARKLSERKGSGGTVQSNVKTGELATRSMAQVRKLKDARQQRSQDRSRCNVRLTLKGLARKKPTPKILKVKSGGHTRFRAGRTKKTHPNTYVIISRTALCNERSQRRTVASIAPKNQRQAKDGRTAHPRRSKKEGGQITMMLKTRSIARPAGNAKKRVAPRDGKRRCRPAR